MPTYSRITICISPDEEMELKAKANEKKISVSAYCREKLLGSELPPNRVCIEDRLEKIEKSILDFQRDVYDMTKLSIQYTMLASFLVTEFIKPQMSDADFKKFIKCAREQMKSEIKEKFGE